MTVEWLTALRGCQRCALASHRTQVVPGEGDPHARVVVVGEAPGAAEDRTGRPFVGPSGRLLRATWAGISDGAPLHILNTVRCRPPANRRPHQTEIEACRPWLDDELARVRPRVVVALGRTAAESLLPVTAGRSDWLGWWQGSFGAWSGPVAVLWHPAAVLRSRHQRLDSWTDELTNVYHVAQGETPPPLRS